MMTKQTKLTLITKRHNKLSRAFKTLPVNNESDERKSAKLFHILLKLQAKRDGLLNLDKQKRL